MALSQSEREKIIQIVSPLLNKSLKEISEGENIRVVIWNLSHIWDISWAIVKINDKTDKYNYAIYINSQTSEKRQRFTFAHELGHYFLHKEILDEKSLITDEKLDSTYLFRSDIFDCIPQEERKMEEEANEFAGNLLMPEEKVKEAWEKTKNLKILASIFDVSISAMSYRVFKLWLDGDE